MISKFPVSYQEILEQNKLIDKFMPTTLYEGTDSYYLTVAKYHSSLDWLMPAVEYIESMNYSSHIYCIGKTTNTCQFTSGGAEVCTGRGKTKIEAIYNAVVLFIEYQNKQKP